MAQNEKQGTGTESRSAAAGSSTGAESPGISTAARGTTSTGSASSPGSSSPTRAESGTEQSGMTVGSTGTSGGQQQQGSRLARREGWDDPLGNLFGGNLFGANPFALFRRLSDDMDRMFFGGGAPQNLNPIAALAGRFIPNIDIEQRDDSIVVRADLPGVQLEDFQVNVDDDALVLQGERRDQREENRGGMRRVERTYGSFRRVIPLPPGANTDAAQARFENGVLEIVIPVQQQSRSRRLDVQSSSGTSTGSTTRDTTRH